VVGEGECLVRLPVGKASEEEMKFQAAHSVHFVCSVVTMWCEGASYSEIGRHFGVSRGVVSGIIKRNTPAKTATKVRDHLGCFARTPCITHEIARRGDVARSHPLRSLVDVSPANSPAGSQGSVGIFSDEATRAMR
jgi:hypothetical protein